MKNIIPIIFSCAIIAIILYSLLTTFEWKIGKKY